MESHKTQLFGLNLEVHGTYYVGGYATHEDPPVPDMFEIELILIEGTVDVTEMLENSYDIKLNSWSSLVEQQILDEQYR